MGKLLDLKFDIDHRLLGVVNCFRGIKSLSLNSRQKAALAATNEKMAGTADGEKCLICGNGPSLNELEFGDFGNTPSIAANFFYKHPDAAALKPKYYVIMDGKVIEGIWPVTMIDEIFSAFPDTSLFLDIRWLDHPILAPYVKDQRIFWILPSLFPTAFFKPRHRLDRPICGLNVVASAISVATVIGYKKLGIAGVDGDGLFREILDMQSHFYDGAKDHSMRNFESMVKSLMLSTENLWAWHGIVGTHKREGIHLQNVCHGGIMDCMERITPKDWLSSN